MTICIPSYKRAGDVLTLDMLGDAFTRDEIIISTQTLDDYEKYQKLYHEGRETYEKLCGPLNHMSKTEGTYRWLDDPWPWEYAKNREV